MLPRPKDNILAISPYVGGKSSAMPARMNTLGRVIKLSSNESPLGPAPGVLEAYSAAAGSLSRYPDGHAVRLRDAIAAAHGLAPERVVCGAGSDELIGLLVHAYAGPGDEMLMSRHGFLMYKLYAQAAGANVVMAPEEGLRTSVEALLSRVTARTRIVFVANPNNPTGSYLSATELAHLRRKLPENVLLAVDAAYAEYVQAGDYSDGQELAASTANTVMLRTFSKIYALPSLRIGWCYGPDHVIDVLNRVRGPFNVSGPAIAAGAAAVANRAHLQRSAVHNAQWLPWLSGQLQALGLTIYPSVGNFMLVKCADSGVLSADAVNWHLLERGIIVREVAEYGLPGHLRITVGLEEENRVLIDALKEIAVD